MSTTAMWLLLAVVIVVILFGSVLYKRTFTTKEFAHVSVSFTEQINPFCHVY